MSKHKEELKLINTMSKKSSPIMEIKARRTFIQFLENEVIAYFHDELPFRNAFSYMADAVKNEPSPGAKIVPRTTRAAQFIKGMNVVKRLKALGYIEKETISWSLRDWEFQFLKKLFTEAMVKNESAVVKLLKDIDDSRDQLNMGLICRRINELTERVLQRLLEEKIPQAALRIKLKAAILKVNLSYFPNWGLSSNSSVKMRRFLNAVFEEIPATQFTFKLPEEPLSATVQYSGPYTPKELASKFDLSWKTIKRRIKKGEIKSKMLTTKSYMIANDDLNLSISSRKPNS